MTGMWGWGSECRESLFPMQMLLSNYIDDVVRRVPRAVGLAGPLKNRHNALNSNGSRPIAKSGVTSGVHWGTFLNLIMIFSLER